MYNIVLSISEQSTTFILYNYAKKFRYNIFYYHMWLELIYNWINIITLFSLGRVYWEFCYLIIYKKPLPD